MSNSTTLRQSLQIVQATSGLVIYNSPLSGYVGSMAGITGPTPGDVLCATGGTTISLAQLIALGGWCEITNKDLVNYVTWGIYVGGTTFAPVSDIYPGEKSGPFRLAKTLLGSGNLLRIVANTSPVLVNISAFDL
jgi:hypothetical protein